jgi:CRP/FNR family cyclic AMP-dependent transcriptional regulator
MDDLITAIEPHATARTVKKRAVLYYQGEIPRQAMILRNGIVKVYTITATGEERIVALHANSGIFPIPWAFGKSSHTLFYYEAVTNCEVLSVSKPIMQKTLAEDPALLDEVFKYVVNEYTSLLLHVTALEQSRAAEKIGFILYYLMLQYGTATQPGVYVIPLKLTHPMIASLVGLTRESVVINLRSLKRKGIIHFHHFTYEINKPKLEKFLGEESFKNLSLS